MVFGSGNADADLMFVGEAPGANEDKQGVPFVGQAGKLLDQLLGEIGLTRPDVFVVNVLECLSYNAQVQLGDGSWERIGRLVRARYPGTVDVRRRRRDALSLGASPGGTRRRSAVVRVFRLTLPVGQASGGGAASRSS